MKNKKHRDYGSQYSRIIATALFILVPTAFLLIIYVKIVSQSD